MLIFQVQRALQNATLTKPPYEKRNNKTFTHRNQSTTRIRVMSSTGSPTADSTITMVTRPAWGTPAAPIEAAVAVMLKNIGDKNCFEK